MRKIIQSVAFVSLLCLGASLGLFAAEEPVSVDFQIYLWPGQSPFALPEVAASNEKDSLSYRWGERSDNPLDIVDPEVFLEAYYRQSNSGDAEKLVVYPRTLTPVQSYRGPRRMQFFQNGVMEAGTEPPLLAQVNLPVGAEKLVLFFFPMPDGSMRILPLEMQESLYVGEHILLVNLSAKPLQCSLGGPAFGVNPGQQVLREVQKMDEYYQPILLASLNENGQLRRRLMRKMGVQSNELTVCLIYNPAGNPEQYQLLQVGLPIVARSDEL
ncbi:hypothetical protein SH580_05230 [Coraliomargarita algicola]|uniref:Uncharacterized protein n=1 Tax=Coraliomargarita algicola TaxID=3092156 RepID=A0ABZ0RPN6_9BACT|nr:hypothetical protein [Coraliomargarita sp. J2-16]WPJ97108.1 hypothetical protein SH580_05230 [Coraliomargarita sp. J2-16]